MADLIFYCQFIQAKTGASAVAPTIDIDRFALADAATATVITGGSPSEGRNGVYYYRLASASPTLYNYIGTFKTASSSVDQHHLSALGIVIPDELTSTRVSASAYTDARATKLDYLDAAISSVGGTGSGAISNTLTFNDGVNPLDGVEVWITTDNAGTNVIAGTSSTNASGQVTFMLDSGSYYVWSQLAGYSFTNPKALTVS